MKYAKRIGALICVIAICFTLVCAPSANAVGALGGQAAGAWIAAGLVALNIVADVAIGSIGSYFGWQAHPTSTTLLQQDIQYTFPVASQFISDYMNAATIKVDQGVTTIDGVEYDELFIEPGTFTNGLKTNLFDFKTKWNILSGQSGITLAKGVGFYDGIPVYGEGPYSYDSQKIEINTGRTQLGEHTYTNAGIASNYNWVDFTQGSNTQISGALSKSNSFPYYIQFTANYARLLKNDKQYPSVKDFSTDSSYFVNSPFQYDYVSGVVPSVASDIPENYGLSIQIPHDQLQTFYNTYPQYNVDNSTINIQQDQIDIDELTQAIFDQIQSMDDIKAEWTSGEEPEPPVPVDPVENIDQNVQDISDYQRLLIDYVDEVENLLNEQGQNVGFINSALEDLKLQIEENSEYIESSAGHLQNILQENGLYYEDFKELMQDIKQDNESYHDDMKQEVDHMHQDVESIHQTQQQQQQIQQQMQQTQQQMQQTQQQVQQDTSSIDSTLKEVTQTPGQADLPSFKLDLRELFPFCIPFDIYRLLSSFDANPQAPHVRLPIVIQSIGFSYTMDLDFSSWDPVAQAMRAAELIVYAIGLAWATGKVIKW